MWGGTLPRLRRGDPRGGGCGRVGRMSLLPIRPQNLREDLVQPPAACEDILTAAPDDLVTGCRLGETAGLVAVEVGRFQLSERELGEGVARAQLHDLASQPLPPHLLVPDQGARRAAAKLPVDLVDPGGADRPAVVLDNPKHAVRITRHLVEPLVLRGQIQRVPAPEELRDLHVLEPGDYRRGVLHPGGTQPDEFALDDGPVHAGPSTRGAPPPDAPTTSLRLPRHLTL